MAIGLAAGTAFYNIYHNYLKKFLQDHTTYFGIRPLSSIYIIKEQKLLQRKLCKTNKKDTCMTVR